MKLAACFLTLLPGLRRCRQLDFSGVSAFSEQGREHLSATHSCPKVRVH